MTTDGRDAHIEMTRTLRLPATQLADALVGLRREMTGRSQRFGLGDRGTLELDANVSPPGPIVAGSAGAPAEPATPVLSATPVVTELRGRLWNPDASAVARVRVHTHSDETATIIVLVPVGEIAPWFRAHIAEYLDLAHAALAELCEELLFHAASQRRAREHA